MLEEQDIKKLKELLATKDDLKGLTTKEDLKLLATKKDLKREIKKEIDGLAVMINRSFDKTEERMTEGFKTVNGRLDKMENIKERVTQIEEAIALK